MLSLNDLVQGSPEWQDARRGIPTASGFDKIVTTKGEPSKQAQKYLWKLAGERVSGFSEETYQNATMQRGIDTEAEARAFYELTNSVTVQTVGICYPDKKKRYACSPDGLVGEDGGLEIKVPLIATHVGYLLDGTFPMDYFQQVQGNLLVTGRKWWDFLSYQSGLKPLLIRVKRDETFIKALTIELEVFCKNLDDVANKIKWEK